MLAVSTLRSLAGLLLVVLATRTVAETDHRGRKKPIVLAETGGFSIAGKTLHSPRDNTTLSCDHAYVEYFIPWDTRETSLVMWHSSSTQVWQNNWDGGEGYKDMFLRRDYPIYLWEGPRVGRANWGCNSSYYVPMYRDQGNFVAWNFGPSYPNFWPDTQFPAKSKKAWDAAVRARYQEFDTAENVVLHANAAAIAADSGRLGESIVYLTNSAGGLRAQLTATKSNTTNIKGMVTYESVGYVFPDNVGVKAGGPGPFGGFGPFVVPVEDFKKLARLPAIQFVFGDHRDETYEPVTQARQVAKLINQYGGNAEVLMLGPDAGLKGSTHIAFADMDNHKVADLLSDFLEDNGLDEYA